MLLLKKSFAIFLWFLSRPVSKHWRTSVSTSDFLVGFRRQRQPLLMPLSVLTGHWFNCDSEGNVPHNESPASHPQHLCSSNIDFPSESWQWPHLTCGSWGWWKQQMSSLRGKNIVETFSYYSGVWHLKPFVVFFFCFWEGWTTDQVFKKWKARLTFTVHRCHYQDNRHSYLWTL